MLLARAGRPGPIGPPRRQAAITGNVPEPDGEPGGGGPLDVALDLAFELIVEPLAPYKQQQALVTVRVSDVDAESLAEGRLTDAVTIGNLTARAAHFAQVALRAQLARPGSSERLFLQIPTSAVPEL